MKIQKMNKFKERRNLSWQGMFYSIQRIDLLIVSICGAGIYVSLETIKYTIEKEMDSVLLVKLAGLSFVIGIVINFLSQIFGHKSNFYDFLMCETEIEISEEIDSSKHFKLKKESKSYDEKSENYSKLTNFFNYVSMFLMSVGLLLITIYFLFILK